MFSYTSLAVKNSSADIDRPVTIFAIRLRILFFFFNLRKYTTNLRIKKYHPICPKNP